ncbi:myosin-2-like [Musa acuminata AAA Group]|uniref:myosin-2-like n=1 Tax=Musa acuminata AAA Group TaxID=214697 RepID=UPI0031DF06CA
MAPMVVRSSLEIMLDAIRQRDERPKDLPPALPVRPTSRGRLPTSKRSLPVNLKLESSAARSLLTKSMNWEDKKEEQTRRSGINVVLKNEVFGSKIISDVEQLVESAYIKMPNLVSYEERVQVADGTDLPPLVVTNNSIDCGGTIKYAMNEVAGLGDAGNQTLQGILWVQKNYRGVRARSRYQQLKGGATTLQSFVRGERARHNFEFLMKRWRAAVFIQKHVRLWLARTVFKNQQKDIIFLQSVIRGCLARKHFTVLKKVDVSKVIHVKDTNNNESPQIHPSILAEFKSQMSKAEAALREKEEENAILKQQLQAYETRWSEYELKMKSMEETWQKQLTALQMSFTAGRKSIVPEEMTKQPGWPDASQTNHYYEAEDDESVGAQTPEGTLAKLPNASDAMQVRNNDTACNAVIQLIKEFDQQRQVFDTDAGLLIEVKSGAINPYEELRNLKSHFASWKKDYKMRLRDTKTALLKLVNPEKRTYKRWWCTTVAAR